jgi:hypothetical protein
MMLKRVAIPSPNYSGRGGAGVRLIVLHTAEGALTIESLGNFFGSKASGVSSHTGIDDKQNTVGEYVNRGQKSWTAANYNPVAVQTELCAFAKWTTAEWDKHPTMLANCAAWIAEEAKAFGIPIMRLTASQAQGSGRGVCQHVDLGSGGGGHWDCGTGFPMDRVLNMARGQQPAPPTQPPSGGKFPTTPPPYPGRLLKVTSPMMQGQDIRTWQECMRARNWAIDIDGIYGNQSASVCKGFQSNKSLDSDGIVGPLTWDKSWSTAVGG